MELLHEEMSKTRFCIIDEDLYFLNLSISRCSNVWMQALLMKSCCIDRRKLFGFFLDSEWDYIYEHKGETA